MHICRWCTKKSGITKNRSMSLPSSDPIANTFSNLVPVDSNYSSVAILALRACINDELFHTFEVIEESLPFTYAAPVLIITSFWQSGYISVLLVVNCRCLAFVQYLLQHDPADVLTCSTFAWTSLEQKVRLRTHYTVSFLNHSWSPFWVLARQYRVSIEVESSFSSEVSGFMALFLASVSTWKFLWTAKFECRAHIQKS